jgi:hypothetical protein
MTREANVNGTALQPALNFAARTRRTAREVRASQSLHHGLTGSVVLLMLLMLALILPGTTLAQGFSPGPVPAALEPLGSKLVGTGASGAAIQGANVAISADGNTAIVGGLLDNGGVGAAWIYVQSPHNVWTQQGAKLVPSNEIGNGVFGANVALSGDGNIAAIGAPSDNGGVGAVWIFTRSAGAWTQRTKLIGTGATGNAGQASAVALSLDGTTLVEGGQNDNSNVGAVWVFTQSGGVWTQQGNKLAGSDASGAGLQGFYVGISAQGNTLVEGAPGDNEGAGAAWVFQRTGGSWSQVNLKIVGAGSSGAAAQGSSVAISGDGATVVEGGPRDNGQTGGIWIFEVSCNVYSQVGNELLPGGSTSGDQVGTSVAMSRDADLIFVGAPGGNEGGGYVSEFALLGGAWTQLGGNTAASDGDFSAAQGGWVSISADGSTAIEGGAGDSGNTGAAWIFSTQTNFGSTPLFNTVTQTIVIQPQIQQLEGIIFGSYRVVIQGAASQDYNLSGAQPGSGTCSTGAVVSYPGTCTVNVDFTPTSPGLRPGAIEIFDNSTPPFLVTIVDLNGTGLGPLLSVTSAVINTIAGNGTPGDNGDGGPAKNAEMIAPYGLATDGADNLYIADVVADAIREVKSNTSIISTVAGTAEQGYSGDGGPATSATINSPQGMRVDGAGNLYISDVQNNVIRMVAAGTGIITTVAGTGTQGYGGDGGLATSATLAFPQDIVFDPAGNFYIADERNNAVRKVNTSGIITTIAGGNGRGFGGDGGPATSAQLFGPIALAMDASGNLYIDDDGNNVIRRVDAVTGTMSTYAGVQGNGGFSGDGGPANQAELNDPEGLAIDPAGNLYITDSSNNVVREVAAGTGTISSIAGTGNPSVTGYSGDGGAATAALFNYPVYPAVDAFGNLYINDDGNSVIREVNGAAPLLFGTFNVGTASGPLSFSITNNGNAALPLEGFYINGDFSFGSATTCNGSSALNAGESCLVSVVFTPTKAGSRTGSVGVGDPIVNLSGTGQSAATTTSLTASPNPATVGAAVTFTAAVSPAPTGSSLGTVDFFDGETSLGTVNVNSSGVAVFMSSSLAAGMHSITAVYSGNSGFATSTSSVLTETINAAVATTTSTSLSASPNPAATGAVVTFTATIAPAPTGTPTGTVTFCLAATGPDVRVGGSARGALGRTRSARGDALQPNTPNFCGSGTVLGTGIVSVSGVATFAISGLAVGPQDITAVYSGNAGFAASTSSVFTETINSGAATTTTTSLTGSPNPATVGAAVTFTAAVSPVPTGPSLGTVSFSDGATLLGTVNLNASGMAAFMTSSLTSGAHSITAVYSGNTGFATSTSSALTETINPATATATTTTLAASPNPAGVGASVTFTATISPVPTGTPTGTVSFCLAATEPDLRASVGTHAARGQTTSARSNAVNPNNVNVCGEGTLLGIGTVSVSGLATFTTSSLALGTNSVTAIYSGNAGFAASTSTAVSQVINPLTPTVTTLIVSPNPGGAGQSITFTGTVAPIPTGSPLGTITFSAGEGPIGTGTVNASGVATLTVTAPSETGTFTITAVYSGNALFATSTSAGLSVTLVTAFGVSAPQTPFPLAQGGMVAIGITVPPIGGAFNSVVTLSATGQPLGSTVTFSPPMVTPGAAGTNTMMTVQLPKLIAGVPGGVPTEISPGGVPRSPGRHVPLTSMSVALLAALLLFRTFGKKRMVRFGLATAACAAVLFVIAGCNGGLAGGSSTPNGTYVITVTGTSGNLHASTTVTIVVTQ